MRTTSNPKTKEKINQLSRYKKNEMTVQRLKERYAILCAKLYSTGSPELSDMPKGGTPPTMEELVAEKVELEERIERAENRSHKLRMDVYNAVDTITDLRQGAIVEKYFVDGQTFNEIGHDMNYSERQIRRLFYEGLEDAEVQMSE